eukprot:2475597-Alexandrium_andersonii.AAC.1
MGISQQRPALRRSSHGGAQRPPSRAGWPPRATASWSTWPVQLGTRSPTKTLRSSGIPRAPF